MNSEVAQKRDAGWKARPTSKSPPSPKLSMPNPASSHFSRMSLLHF